MSPYLEPAEDPLIQATDLVRRYLRGGALERTDPAVEFAAYVVWFAFTLGNWKALVSTTLADGRYYEVTHNAVKQETYLDVYVKVMNRRYVS